MNVNGADVHAFLWMAGGVLVAVVWPVLAHYIKEAFGTTGAIINVKKYVLLLVFSALTAVLLLAIWHMKSTAPPQWHEAFLLGFSWESTIEKFFAK